MEYVVLRIQVMWVVEPDECTYYFNYLVQAIFVTPIKFQYPSNKLNTFQAPKICVKIIGNRCIMQGKYKLIKLIEQYYTISYGNINYFTLYHLGFYQTSSQICMFFY